MGILQYTESFFCLFENGHVSIPFTKHHQRKNGQTFPKLIHIKGANPFPAPRSHHNKSHTCLPIRIIAMLMKRKRTYLLPLAMAMRTPANAPATMANPIGIP
jgi:hypothetical protein